MLLDKSECFECKVNVLFLSVLQYKICLDPPQQLLDLTLFPPPIPIKIRVYMNVQQTYG